MADSKLQLASARKRVTDRSLSTALTSLYLHVVYIDFIYSLISPTRIFTASKSDLPVVSVMGKCPHRRPLDNIGR